jgi:protein-disulfide isomerase
MTIALRFALVAGLALAVTACGDKKPDSTATTTPAASTAPAATAAAETTPAAPAAPAGAPASKDWTQVVAATPQGGFRMGNPDAKVKLVEFASLTCPHCREFHETGMATIKSKYIATGNVSYEYRNFVLNGPDFAASLLARCQGAEPFFGLLNAFYNDQASWTEPFTKITPAENTRLSALPPEQQITATADAGKLDAYVRARGIPRAKFEQCLADPKAQATLTALRTEATNVYKLNGTPGFVINGVTQEGVYTWAQLEPKLQAALQ